MTTKILIPAKAILVKDLTQLDLVNPARCSRCDSSPAHYFETHPLIYQAGFMKYRSIAKRFETVVKFNLRLPLCEKCYRMNFLEDPESMKRDSNHPLATVARWRSVGIVTASLITCAAFILLMKVIPLPAGLESLWAYLVEISLFIFTITLGWVALKNRSVKRDLIAENYDLQLHRALTKTDMQAEAPQPEDVAVKLVMQNDSWAEECAISNNWKYQKE